MTTTAAQIHHLMPEMAPTIGGHVRKVWCRDPHTCVMEVRQGGQNHYLRLSVIEGAAGACMVDGKPKQPPEPPSFVMLLRKILTGSRLLSVAQVQEDRLLRLDVLRKHFNEEDETTTEARYALIAELTSRSPNLFLLDEDGHIMGSARDTQRSRRSLGQGQVYESPQPPSPEVTRRAWQDPLDLESLPADGARSRRLAAHLDDKAALDEARALASALLKRLRRQRKSLDRRVTAIEADLQRAEDATVWRRWGELLQSAYGQDIPRGSESACVPDFYAEGMPTVEVPLDPTLDLQGNIARYFKRYRKYKNAEDTIMERLVQAEEARDALLAALTEAENLAFHATRGALGTQTDTAPPSDPLGAIAALTTGLEKRRILPRRRPQQAQGSKSKGQGPAKALPYREFTSKKGLTIYVGKGGKHNDTLSLKIARGNDLWLHTQDWAGAHVIVRLAKGAEIDEQTLLDAATLAAHYSKGRNDTLIDVSYTRAKNVRKPKGMPPGRVTVANTRTIAVKIEPERLSRLFGDSG